MCVKLLDSCVGFKCCWYEGRAEPGMMWFQLPSSASALPSRISFAALGYLKLLKGKNARHVQAKCMHTYTRTHVHARTGGGRGGCCCIPASPPPPPRQIPLPSLHSVSVVDPDGGARVLMREDLIVHVAYPSGATLLQVSVCVCVWVGGWVGGCVWYARIR
jgi:hypothetical protein